MFIFILIVFVLLFLGFLSFMRQKEALRLRYNYESKISSLLRYRILEIFQETTSNRNSQISKKLREAGLTTNNEKWKYVLLKLFCILIWPIIVFFSYKYFSTYYATVSSIFSFSFCLLTPVFWLKRKKIQKEESIERELPLFIDLLNLATSAGLETTLALEKVIDALCEEFTKHPLIAELRKARWLASEGYTWKEALERVSIRLKNEAVTRTIKALIQSIEKGGERHLQMALIAEDSQNAYYAVLDKRLAKVPFRALMITMVLFLVYLLVLLAPSFIGMYDTLDFL